MIFFFSSCRARSRLGRSSKRLVVGQLFSGCERTGEMQKARCPECRNKTNPKTQTQTKYDKKEDIQWTKWTTLSQLGVIWNIYSQELLCHREEVLSVMRIVFSASVVSLFSGSSFVVFVWVVFVFWVCFVSTLEDTWLFAFHLFWMADRPQDVLMTVRASSVHGMS